MDLTVSRKGGFASVGAEAPGQYGMYATSMKQWESKSNRVDARTIQKYEINPRDSSLILTVDFKSYWVGILEGNQLRTDKEASEVEGKTLKIIFEKDGRLRDWSGFEAIPYVGRTLTNMNELTLFHYVLSTHVFPPHRVKIGDRWTRTGVVPLRTRFADTELHLQEDYTLVGFEMKKGRKCAVIEGELQVKVKKGIRYASDVAVSGKGKGKSRIYFDFEEGILVAQSDKMKMELYLEGLETGRVKGKSTIYIDFEKSMEVQERPKT